MDIGRPDRGEAAAVDRCEKPSVRPLCGPIRCECISCIMAFLLACCCFFRYNKRADFRERPSGKGRIELEGMNLF